MIKCKTALSFLFFITCSINANNTVHYGEFTISFDDKKPSIIHVVNDNGSNDFSCKINNWESRYDTGGDIAITNDGKGVLIYPTNKYLSTDELIDCNGGDVELHKIPQSDDRRYTIVDINFEKKIVLLLALEDVRNLTYTAIVSKFDSNKNLLNGPGFLNENRKVNFSFPIGDSQYGGKISLDGDYVSPVFLDCAIDSFPGVWDIKRNMKVTFPSGLGDEEIKTRCQKLFDGQATLNELDGNLLRPQIKNHK